MADPRAIRLNEAPTTVHDRGVRDRETKVEGTRWALVEYSPGAGRADWCDTPHSGYVLDGTLMFTFEDGRDPLEVASGEAFVLPAEPRHRGINEGKEPARLFVIDELHAA